MIFRRNLDQTFSGQDASQKCINHTKREETLNKSNRRQGRQQDHPQKIWHWMNEKKAPVLVIENDGDKSEESADTTDDPAFHIQVADARNITSGSGFKLTGNLLLRRL